MTNPEEHSELPPSRLHTLIDADSRYALCLVEGQRLIRDLALIHDLRGEAFAWFRTAVLSVQPLIALIKRGEQLGFYVDSETPSFHLKIETGHTGDVRCTLAPEGLSELADEIHGLVRLYTLFPDRSPHESILRADGLGVQELVNLVLRDSYQIAATTHVAEGSDQSVMLHQLPALRGEDPADFGEAALERRFETLRPDLDAVLDRGLSDPRELAEALAPLGFRPLSSRSLQFRCGCSRERMVHNVRLVRDQGLFDPGDTELVIVCDYCKERHVISREEVEAGEVGPH